MNSGSWKSGAAWAKPMTTPTATGDRDRPPVDASGVLRRAAAPAIPDREGSEEDHAGRDEPEAHGARDPVCRCRRRRPVITTTPNAQMPVQTT
jgi:hypothetical protein